MASFPQRNLITKRKSLTSRSVRMIRRLFAPRPSPNACLFVRLSVELTAATVCIEAVGNRLPPVGFFFSDLSASFHSCFRPHRAQTHLGSTLTAMYLTALMRRQGCSAWHKKAQAEPRSISALRLRPPFQELHGIGPASMDFIFFILPRSGRQTDSGTKTIYQITPADVRV